MDKFEFYWKFVERPERIISGFINRKILKRDNAYLIQKEVNKHRGELCIDPGFEMVKLLGWTDQYDDDYYYVVGSRSDIRLQSCVGGFTWLKGSLDGFEYYGLLKSWDRNLLCLVDATILERDIILK